MLVIQSFNLHRIIPNLDPGIIIMHKTTYKLCENAYIQLHLKILN